MLTLSQNLPPEVLVGMESAALAARMAATGGIWFHGDPDHVMVTDDAISGWRAMNSDVTAVLTAPNAGSSQFDIDHLAFVFQAGIHCGFTLPNAVQRISTFTAALIFASPEDEARSLFALNTGATNAMIFLSEADGMIFAKDRNGVLEVALPAASRSAKKQLVILSFANHTLTLSYGGASVSRTGRAEGLAAAADLFIGCRSNRPGLVKTLGASRIHDVMFWPNRALLGSEAADDVAALAAVNRYARWTR